MLPNKFTPPKAETDLPLGRARIPANWSLQLVPILATRLRVQHALHLDAFSPHSLSTWTPQNPRNFLVVDADGDILQVSCSSLQQRAA